MSYKRFLGDIDLTKELTLLLLIGGMYSLSIALSNTFVNIYLWKQSGDLSISGIYNLTVVILQPLTFILAGRWAKKVDRVIVLRIGVIFLASSIYPSLSFGASGRTLSCCPWGTAWNRVWVLLAGLQRAHIRNHRTGDKGLFQWIPRDFDFCRRNRRTDACRIYHFPFRIVSRIYHCLRSFPVPVCRSRRAELLLEKETG